MRKPVFRVSDQVQHKPGWEAQWPSGRALNSGARGRGFDPHSRRHVVSLSEIHLPPKKYW